MDCNPRCLCNYLQFLTSAWSEECTFCMYFIKKKIEPGIFAKLGILMGSIDFRECFLIAWRPNPFSYRVVSFAKHHFCLCVTFAIASVMNTDNGGTFFRPLSTLQSLSILLASAFFAFAFVITFLNNAVPFAMFAFIINNAEYCQSHSGVNNRHIRLFAFENVIEIFSLMKMTWSNFVQL